MALDSLADQHERSETASSPAGGEAHATPPAGQELSYFGPAPGWKLFDFSELWNYRELGWVLASRELKIRYRQAVIGVAWVVLQPVLMFLVFQLILERLTRAPITSGAPYALTFFCGWLPWQLFAVSVRDGTQTLVTNRQLVTKVYFPRELLPTAGVICGLVELAISLCVLILLMAWHRFSPPGQAPLVLLFIVLAALLSLGAGLWLSALNALYRDIGYVVPFLLQVGFFASPVAYEVADTIPAAWWWYELNPLVGIMTGVRWALLDAAFPSLRMLSFAVIGTLAILISGLWYFRRVEAWIADRI